MKIERINESQMKFVLTKNDLEKRCLDVTDLAYGSSKTQELFQDIIDTAIKDFSFNMEDTPLMIEAVPTSKSSIMIILTKVSNPVSYKEQDGKLQKTNKSIGDFLPLEPERVKDKNNEKREKSNKKILKNASNRTLIYAFKNLDDVSNVAKLLDNSTAQSMLYKYNNEYLLTIIVRKEHFSKVSYINHVLGEYGNVKLGAEELLIAYYKENGDCIIDNNAIRVLSKF